MAIISNKSGAGLSEEQQQSLAQIPKIWVSSIADIRAITTPHEDWDVGNYTDNSVYEFDPASVLADDGIEVLAPDDATAGRWIRKVQFADRNQVVNQIQDSILGVDDTSGYYKSPYASTGNAAFKILDKNNNIGAYFTDKGDLFFDENVKIASINPSRAFLIQHNGSYWGNGLLYMKDNVVIDKNNYIGFAYNPGYPTATIRLAYSVSGAAGIGQKTKHILVSNNDGYVYISASGNFGINTQIVGDIKGIFQLRNTKLPTNLSNGNIIRADGTNIITAINLYDEFRFDVKIGSIISIDSVNYTVTAVNSDTEIELNNTVPDGDYIYLIEDINNKISVTRYGYTKISDNAGEDSTKIAKERLDVSDTTKIQGLRKALSTKTADYPLTKQDSVIRTDSTANTIDITFPELSTNWHGQIFTVKTKVLTNVTKVVCSGADKLEDGTTFYVFSAVNELKSWIGDNDAKQWVEL